jgi:hypothetical protein
MSTVVSPLQAAVGAFVVEAGNVAVAFGAFGASTATVVESAITGAVAIGFVVANELRAKTVVEAAKPQAVTVKGVNS